MNDAGPAQVVLVTGAGGGLGAAIVDNLLGAGFRVAGCDVAPVPERSEPGWLGIRCDITDPAAVAAMVDEVTSRLGPVDAVVNNAAIQVTGDLLATSAADFRAVLDVNLTGSFLVAQAAVRDMLDRDRPGAIVNISSVLGLVADSELLAYTCSKTALLGLTRAIAVGYADRGIRCNAVCPGDIRTTMSAEYSAHVGLEQADLGGHYPAKRIAEPEDVLGLIRFLISPSASYVTGQPFVIDGGLLARCY